VVAFGVYEKTHVGVEVAGGFTDRADVWGLQLGFERWDLGA